MNDFIHLVYGWLMRQFAYATDEDRTRFMDELFAPPTGVDPDKVTAAVVEEEMSMFRSLARQTGHGG